MDMWRDLLPDRSEHFEKRKDYGQEYDIVEQDPVRMLIVCFVVTSIYTSYQPHRGVDP